MPVPVFRLYCTAKYFAGAACNITAFFTDLVVGVMQVAYKYFPS